MDWLSYTYISSFVLGLVFTVAAFLWSGNEPAAEELTPAQWFNLPALLVALTWLGGAGFVMQNFGLTQWFGLPFALIIGAVGYFVTSRPTTNAYKTHQSLVGEVAQVISLQLDEQGGKIICVRDGVRHQLEARSLSGQVFTEGANVAIIRLQEGIAYIEDLNKILAAAGAEKWVNSQYLTPDP